MTGKNEAARAADAKRACWLTLSLRLACAQVSTPSARCWTGSLSV